MNLKIITLLFTLLLPVIITVVYVAGGLDAAIITLLILASIFTVTIVILLILSTLFVPTLFQKINNKPTHLSAQTNPNGGNKKP